ncbi:sigma-70 family RNA polymerase sigma factor [Paenibacillus senegalensis]|uniref:sigma-70 family RNA polymerase sigma factor n=1 Tax=Paenibacillus senegalensis TaxID=1465766 RepID=UPI0002883E34|nr:sigma-70 family RNA polymerase sigma factor [Paenibacillus senegalensis]
MKGTGKLHVQRTNGEWLSMESLAESYKGTQRMLWNVKQNQQHEPAQSRMLSEMAGDCGFVVEWIQAGRMPGNRRGIERRAAYQREKLVDPIHMQAYVQRSAAGSPANLSDGDRARLEQALSMLSDRERECYLLAHGECFSYQEIAELLQVTKGSVSQYIRRAQIKLSKLIEAEEH